MDALMLLKQDHRTVESLFARFEKAGDDAYTLKGKLVEQMITSAAPALRSSMILS